METIIRRILPAFLAIFIAIVVALPVAEVPFGISPQIAYAQTTANTNPPQPDLTKINQTLPAGCTLSWTNWSYFTNFNTCFGGTIASYVALILVGASAYILNLVGALFDSVFTLTVLGFGGLIKGGVLDSIKIAWGSFRDIANILIIAMLVYAALRTILGIREYGAKGLVARVVIIAILINFSLLFTEIAIDTSNFAATQFYQHFPLAQEQGTVSSGVGTSQTTQSGIAVAFERAAGVTTITQTSKSVSDLATSPNGGFVIALFYGIVTALLLLVIAIVLLYGTYLLISRAIIFVFLMLTSSIAFASYLIPGKGESIAWRPWLNALFSNALVAPVMIVLLWVAASVGTGFRAAAIAAAGQDAANASLANLASGSSMTGAGAMTMLFGYIVVVGLLYLAFHISASLSRSVGGKWSATVDTRVRGFATNGVARFGGLGWQQTAQRLALRRGESNQAKSESHRNLALQSTTNAAFARQAGREQDAKRHEAQAGQHQRIAASFEQRSERLRNFANKQNLGGIEGLGKRVERRAKQADSLAKRIAPTRDEQGRAQEVVMKSVVENVQTTRQPDRAALEEVVAQAEQRRTEQGAVLQSQLTRAQANAATTEHDAGQKKETVQPQHQVVLQELTRQTLPEPAEKKEVIQKELEKQAAEHSSTLNAQDERIKTANAEVQRITDELGKLDQNVKDATDALLTFDKETATMASAAAKEAGKITNETFVDARESAVRQAARAGSITTMRSADENSIVTEALRNRSRSQQSDARLKNAIKDFTDGGAAPSFSTSEKKAV